MADAEPSSNPKVPWTTFAIVGFVAGVITVVLVVLAR